MFQTEKEMLEGAGVLRGFDFEATKAVAGEIGRKRIIFAGMGSSILFPGKQARSRASELNLPNRVEAYFASELLQYKDFRDTHVFLLSNSGMTKETIMLLAHLKKKGAGFTGITAVNDSILAKKCNSKIIMGCGFESGVAATKSVMEQALLLDSIIFHLAQKQNRKINFRSIDRSLKDASNKVISNIGLKLPKNALNSLARADSIYFVGRDTGVLDEISLKAHEIARKNAFFYPDTDIVHGIEESITPGPLVIFEPSKFRRFLGDFKRFSKSADCSLFCVDSHRSPGINALRIKSNDIFHNYCLLAAGWGILRNIANRLHINMDMPKKAVKIGNPYRK
ncbi:SIS domain-containing protein [Candidatus Woesearchaeota archaeon]|nr:SIS domain-containing protein [Candidatus Woesearchaeota archaeon]